VVPLNTAGKSAPLEIPLIALPVPAVKEVAVFDNKN